MTTLKNFSGSGGNIDYGTPLTQQELNSLFIKNIILDGYKWNAGIQHQTFIKVGNIYSDGFINVEELNSRGDGFIDSKNKDWANNKGNTMMIELPQNFNLQIYGQDTFMKANDLEKSNQLIGLARFYTDASNKLIEAKSAISQIRSTLTAQAKQIGAIVEVFDRLPMKPELYANDATRAQLATQVKAVFDSQMPILQNTAVMHSFGSLFNPGGALEGHTVYRKEENGRVRLKIRKG